MIVFLYRWRIKPGFEQQFIDSWSEITAYYRKNAGSLGSRLHKGSDGLFYGYAQWKSAEDRSAAFENRPAHPAREKMQEAVQESFDEIRLDPVADYLILPK